MIVLLIRGYTMNARQINHKRVLVSPRSLQVQIVLKKKATLHPSTFPASLSASFKALKRAPGARSSSQGPPLCAAPSSRLQTANGAAGE
mmetsp:Transcript_7075/g.13082  ORF Transcript_7075/g.13082 Transcript_7075/m.13082 type:complete len:89 (+) Transcript_7075:1-267(+)